MITTDRYDIYAPIHKALRQFMTDTLQRLGRLDLDDPQDLLLGLAQLDALLDAGGHHVQHENAFIHPAIEAHSRGASARIVADHQEHLDAIAALRAEAATLRAMPTPALAHRLYRHLTSFVAENFEHMDMEETAHNRALWAACSDAELQAIEGRIHASIDTAEMNVWLRWLIPALNPAERAALIGGLPPEARAPVLETARRLLDDSAWVKLCLAQAPTAVSAA